MKTLYAACLSRLGLSQAEAATYHKVGLQTVKNWCVDRTPVPNGIWDELRAYEGEIVDRSEAIREAWEESGEIRDLVALGSTDRRNLMALADFLLTTDESPPIAVTLLD